MPNVVFRRRNGKIIPMRLKGGTWSHDSHRSAKKIGKVAAVTGAGIGVGAAIGSAHKFASTGLALAGGIVGGLRTTSLKNFVGLQAASFGLDIASTAANARHAQTLKGSKKEKLKAFGKQELFNMGVGWTALGTTALLSSPNVRAGFKTLLQKLIKRG